MTFSTTRGRYHGAECVFCMLACARTGFGHQFSPAIKMQKDRLDMLLRMSHEKERNEALIHNYGIVLIVVSNIRMLEWRDQAET